MSVIDTLKDLRDQRDQMDNRIVEGIKQIEDELRELKLGIPLRIEVPFEGHLSYEKEGNRWKFMFDNTKFNHNETNVPLINCSRRIRTVAVQYMPALIHSAIEAITEDIAEKAKAQKSLGETFNLIQQIKGD